MYALLALVAHVVVSSLAALVIAPYSLAPGANMKALWVLSLASAVISTIGLMATAVYLSRRLRPVSGGIVGVLCGALCGGIVGMVMQGTDFSVVLYLAILAPTLLAVLLASLLDRPKSGWQT
jgi:hypothetical protein